MQSNIPQNKVRLQVSVREKTKLQALVENEIGNVEVNEILLAIPETVQKIVWIVQNEGTAQGKRLKAEYIAKIIAERITADRFVERLKKEADHKNGHASEPIYYSITMLSKNQ